MTALLLLNTFHLEANHAQVAKTDSKTDSEAEWEEEEAEEEETILEDEGKVLLPLWEEEVFSEWKKGE